jgi:hypothetical protein
LQALTPWHLILAGSAALATDTATVLNSSAAATAIAAPIGRAGAREGAREGAPLDTGGGCSSVVTSAPPPGIVIMARQSQLTPDQTGVGRQLFPLPAAPPAVGFRRSRIGPASGPPGRAAGRGGRAVQKL